ncbi:MAG: DNA repair protein RecN [Wenzhouxiangella sp.]
MLRALSIRHFAIIEELELEFEPGFTAITGETGAGKSILVDALGQLLGDRADSSLVATDQGQADLSAEFALDTSHPARQWLSEQAMDDGDSVLIRRVLPVTGSSRGWINGRPATMGQLAELGRLLVEIHGQHEHHQLEKASVQRRLLDRELPEPPRERVAADFTRWQDAQQTLKALEADSGDLGQIELMRFQLDELDRLNLEPGEFEQLENEQERLARADDIRAARARALAALDSDEQPGVRALLHTAQAALERLGSIDSELHSVAAMLAEASINIDEAISTLERQGEPEEDEPEKLARINQRLQRCLDLARKHRVEPGQLTRLTGELRQRLERFDNQDQERQGLQTALAEALGQWRESAASLHKARRKAAATLEGRILERLAELGMDKARFQVAVEALPDTAPNPHGGDRIDILFSANPGQPLRSLGRVASGGELSRVSLAMMIAADHQAPKVRVFDEVDAGIGGETAGVVGRFLRQAADGGQAFCVTHLAQVAAYADHQINVRKTASQDRTGVQVSPLAAGERVEEIARMLGNAGSAKGREHAKEMLDACRKS